jgi:hypothetical protein
MKKMKLAGYLEGYMCKEAYWGEGWVNKKIEAKGEDLIDKKLNSQEAYIGAGGLGAIAGGGMGMGLGAAYADDEESSKLPYVGYGGLMGAGAGAVTGMALLALVNTYRDRQKKQEK